MNTEIMTVLLSGLFGAVIAPLTAQVLIPLLNRRITNKSTDVTIEDTTHDKSGRAISTFLQAGSGGLIGVLVGYLLVVPIVSSSCLPLTPPKATITSPVSGTSVPRLVTVQGTSCHISNDSEFWLLVVPEGVTSFYPQTGPIVISSDGTWSASAYIGMDEPADVGRGFILIAALVDQQGGAAIREYFGQAGPEFVGLEPLPQGIQLIDQVRVVRK